MEYSYDAFGNRIKRVQKNGSGTITSDERYAYDGWDTAKDAPRGSENFDAYADLSSANAVTTRRVYGADFDEAVGRVASAGTTAWYLTDRQGSVRRVLDNSGTITGSRDFSAFGAITVSSGAGLDRYAYTAREWDSTLGLQYTRARMYDPVVGRFLREDPLGLSAGDENLFRYVGNAHTLSSDPSGLDWIKDFGRGLDVLTERFQNGMQQLERGVQRLPDVAKDKAEEIARKAENISKGNFNEDLVKGLQLLKHDPVANGWKCTQEAVQIVTAAPRKLGEGLATGDPRKIVEGISETGLQYMGMKDFLKTVGKPTCGRCPKTGEPLETQPVKKSCFPAGTPVHVSEGLKSIEFVEVGDEVWSFDHRRATWALRKVVDAYVIHHEGLMATVRIAGETVHATGGHPYWVIRGEDLANRPKPVKISAYEVNTIQVGRWVLAKDLREGDVVLLRDIGEKEIESIHVNEVTETVYNFTVDDLQNYAVGATGVLVHNTNDQTGKLPEKPKTLEQMSAAERRAEFIARGIPEGDIGPSGYPKVHIVEKATMKQAEDAARQAGSSKPVQHNQDVGQPPHFHAVDRDGVKLTGKDNVHYQKRGDKP